MQTINLKIIIIILLDIFSFFILKFLGIDLIPCLWISFLPGIFQYDKKFLPFFAFFLATLFLRGGFFAWMINWPLYLSIPLVSIVSQGTLSYRPKKIIPYLIGY